MLAFLFLFQSYLASGYPLRLFITRGKVSRLSLSDEEELRFEKNFPAEAVALLKAAEQATSSKDEATAEVTK